MILLKDSKIEIIYLFGSIPETLLSHLSTSAKRDNYSKILNEKKMFYLLLYGILGNERL